MKMKNIVGLGILSLILHVLISCNAEQKSNAKTVEYLVKVPMGGNAWVVNDNAKNRTVISDKGIVKWTDKETVIRAWFRAESAGVIQIGIEGKQTSEESKIKLIFEGEEKEIILRDKDFSNIDAGTFNVKKPGYYYVELQGIKTSGSNFGEIKKLLLGGEVAKEMVYYVKDDFYWGRRGPSVHLGYKIPEGVEDVTWFYNEITVPEGEDVIGSYYMANGFGEGYFGIQVNSPTERRILFSVWSPYKTDNPNDIPEDERIKLLKKGNGVNTGSFGNEGSGGQSYKVYNWKAGNTYRFLLKGHPSQDNCTDYTAYFYAPEKDRWELIASFRRPKTSTYLKRPHSFLENFITEMGIVSRKAFYTNQWVVDKNNEWYELNEAVFTADATARKHARRDYAGGVKEGAFYLQNCGFFNDRVAYDQSFKRPKTGNKPTIDFSKLP